MEAILNKKRCELIKEGLSYIDSWERFIKSFPNTYAEYLSLKEDKLICYKDPYHSYKDTLNFTKNYTKEDDYIEDYTEMFDEIETYINTFKPKVVLYREDLEKIYDILNVINRILIENRNLKFQSILDFPLKCIPFFKIESIVLPKLKTPKNTNRLQKED